MNIRELKEKLVALDEDLPIFVRDGRSGCCDALGMGQVTTLNLEEEGAGEILDEEDGMTYLELYVG